jgi:hypothetical protein
VSTLPLAVILNRLETDFLVLIPFGRRINWTFSIGRKSGELTGDGLRIKRYFDHPEANDGFAEVFTAFAR